MINCICIFFDVQPLVSYCFIPNMCNTDTTPTLTPPTHPHTNILSDSFVLNEELCMFLICFIWLNRVMTTLRAV